VLWHNLVKFVKVPLGLMASNYVMFLLWGEGQVTLWEVNINMGTRVVTGVPMFSNQFHYIKVVCGRFRHFLNHIISHNLLIMSNTLVIMAKQCLLNMNSLIFESTTQTLIPWNRQAPLAHYAGWCASPSTRLAHRQHIMQQNGQWLDCSMHSMQTLGSMLSFGMLICCNGLTWHFTGQNGRRLDRSILHKNQGWLNTYPAALLTWERRLVWKRTELAESSCPAWSGQWLVEDGQQGNEGGVPEWWGGAARRPSLRERHGGRQGCPLFPAPHAPRLFSSTMLLWAIAFVPDFFLSFFQTAARRRLSRASASEH
jgi:hypothetical protein